MSRFFSIVFCLLVITVSAVTGYGSSKIYLLPEVEVTGDNIKISHIAVIEGTEAVSISDLVIPSYLVKNEGIIDKREIYGIITDSGYSGFVIFGNGVRINIRKEEKVFSDNVKDYAVNKGDNVDIIVLKNGVKIEIQGESLSRGQVGEVIKVSAGKKRIINGTVTGKRRVVLELK